MPCQEPDPPHDAPAESHDTSGKMLLEETSISSSDAQTTTVEHNTSGEVDAVEISTSDSSEVSDDDQGTEVMQQTQSQDDSKQQQQQFIIEDQRGLQLEEALEHD
ncbi:hypothetical protein K7X08_027582 [Anisodus acutangulus]|uniref:Uncharacterized protein n=1 Tax=Anisodus acutangulus TaxID=402998 RepID=A0A9Q1MPL8_9SOLA|nr:hypothetical protein K7X08_027582 [Anisodus acutangulus]